MLDTTKSVAVKPCTGPENDTMTSNALPSPLCSSGASMRVVTLSNVASAAMKYTWAYSDGAKW